MILSAWRRDSRFQLLRRGNDVDVRIVAGYSTKRTVLWEGCM